MPTRRLFPTSAAAALILAATCGGAAERNAWTLGVEMPEGSGMEDPLNLPDGRILLTEKQRGLSVIHPDGTRIGPVKGAPVTSDSGINRDGLVYGVGWHLEVAPHPDYASNGWNYLHHTDLCGHCRRKKYLLFFPKSMNRLVRGRIRDGQWVDQEIIWSADERFYTPYPDLGAGGRIAFDASGHVFLSIGTKGVDYEGIQDLRTPYGKIHRVRDDGAIPIDNPFVDDDRVLPSSWTYGHRVPQGLPARGVFYRESTVEVAYSRASRAEQGQPEAAFPARGGMRRAAENPGSESRSVRIA